MDLGLALWRDTRVEGHGYCWTSLQSIEAGKWHVRSCARARTFTPRTPEIFPVV